MAKRRLISTKISVNLQIQNLSIKSRLLFTWLIPHSDDIGILPYEARVIKGLVLPIADDYTIDDVEKGLKEMLENDLISIIEYKGQKYYYLKKFFNNQTLKQDRQPQTLLPIQMEKNPKKTWQNLKELLAVEDNGIQMEDNGIQMASEVKIREDKISNLNIIAESIDSAGTSFDNTTKKKKKETTPEEKQFQKDAVELIEYWKTKWERSMGKKATVTAWGRFIKTAKQFLKIHGLPRMKMLCDAYFITFDDQLIKSNSWGLNIFLLDSTINKLNSKY